jgi:hypothetical protein
MKKSWLRIYCAYLPLWIRSIKVDAINAESRGANVRPLMMRLYPELWIEKRSG